MTSLGNGHERRGQPRTRCLKGARIVLANGNSTLACRVRNHSLSGLRLAADETAYIPDTFTLVHDGTTAGHTCEVTWRSAQEIGAKVVTETEVDGAGYNRGTPLLRKRQVNADGRYPV